MEKSHHLGLAKPINLGRPRLPNTYTKLLVHIVFGTKNRAAAIPDSLRDDLYSYIGGIVRGEGGSLKAIGGMPDHLHLLVRVGPQASISNLLQKVKANSSRWLRRRIRNGSFWWQSGYAAFSVSESAAPRRSWCRPIQVSQGSAP